jgi:hypothetical protein
VGQSLAEAQPHAPFTHAGVVPEAVQSLHVPPLVPHAASSVPARHVPPEDAEQQPVLHSWFAEQAVPHTPVAVSQASCVGQSLDEAQPHTPFRHAGVMPEQAAPMFCQPVPSGLHCCGCVPLQPSALGVQPPPSPPLLDPESTPPLPEPPPDPLLDPESLTSSAESAEPSARLTSSLASPPLLDPESAAEPSGPCSVYP